MPEQRNVQTWLSEALNIEEGEHRPVFFLFLHSFFLGVIVAFYYTASVDLFLQQFSGSDIAWGYVAGGVLSLLVSYGYGALARRMAFSKLLIINLAFLLVSIGLFSVVARFDPGGVLTFVIFIWFNLIIYLTAVAFWGLASRFFNLRQGKRLFGLISTGDVFSGILGFLAVPVLLNLGWIEKPDLLVICTATMALWLLFLLLTIRRFKAVIDIEPAVERAAPEPAAARKATRFFKDRYNTLVFALALLPIFVLWYLDFIFLDLTNKAADDGVFETASFLGIVYTVVKVAELILKGFLSGNLLKRYGIKLGLVALPFMLAVSALLAFVFGLIDGSDAAPIPFLGVTALFACIILAKVLDRSIRTAINDPAFQILYQPVPADERLHFQNRIEGGPRQMGIFLAGGVVIFLEFMEMTNVSKVFLLVLILVGWLGAARLMYQAYRRKVQETLEEARAQSVRSLGSAPSIDALKAQLKDQHHEKIENALRLLGKLEPASIEAFLVDLLDYPASEVRRAALQEIQRQRVLAARAAVERLGTTDPDAEVRQVALRAWRTLSEMEALCASFEQVAALARADDAEQRRFGTMLLGYATDPAALSLLTLRLHDEDPAVRQAALIAAGRTGNPDFWPLLLEHLGATLYCSAAASALVELGEAVLPTLARYFGKMSHRPEVLLRIIHVYGRIGGQQAGRLLWEQIGFPDDYVFFQILQALRLCNYQAPDEDLVFIRNRIRENVDNIAWLLAGLRDLRRDEDYAVLRKALANGIRREQEELFLMLSLSYDANVIDLVRDRFNEEGEESKIFALELLDLLMTQDAKAIILPIFEDTAVARRLRRLEPQFPQLRLTRRDRLKEIINREYTRVDRWAKACALEALAVQADGAAPDELRANLFNPDPMLCEAAAMALYRTDPDAYRAEIKKLGRRQQRALDRVVEQAVASGDAHPRLVLMTEKVAFLHQIPVFAQIPADVLALLVPSFDEVALAEEVPFIYEGDRSTDLYIVIDGQVRVDVGGKTVAQLGAQAIIGEMAVLMGNPRNASVITQEPTRLFRLGGDQFFELVFDQVRLTGELVLLLDRRERGRTAGARKTPVAV